MPYLYIETAGYHLCKGDRLVLGNSCNKTLGSVRAKTAPLVSTIIFPEQSADAIIYVTVVIVFYAAIILILVGTNLKRFRPNSRPPNQVEVQKEVVVHADRKEMLVDVPEDREHRLNPGGKMDVAIV